MRNSVLPAPAASANRRTAGMYRFLPGDGVARAVFARRETTHAPVDRDRDRDRGVDCDRGVVRHHARESGTESVNVL